MAAEQFKYAITAGVGADTAHAVIYGETEFERAACRKGLNLREQRYTPRQVDRSPYLRFCFACDRKVNRVSCGKPGHGMFNGETVDDCPKCAEDRSWGEQYEARIAADNARGLSVDSTSTAPADQREPRFETFADGNLERERPISGTSLRSDVGRRSHIGQSETWTWARTIRGRAYQFTLVRMEKTGQIRIFARRFNGYAGGPRWSCAWTRIREIIFTPEVKSPEAKPAGPTIVGCVYVGLGEHHRYQPGTDVDLDELYDNGSEPCMRAEDHRVHQVDDAPQPAVTTQEVIKARRQRAFDTARCRGCGTTREVCRDEASNRLLGPEAPCCPECFHDPAENLDALIKEIMAGDVRPPSDWMPGAVLGLPCRFPMRPPADWLLYQAEWWKPRDGKLVRISDMDPEWRYNSAAMLLRNAERHAWGGAFRLMLSASGPLGPSGDAACDALDGEVEAVTRDPEKWVCQTPLYRALTAGLPTGGKKLARLQERAKHWNTCPARSGMPGACTCPPASSNTYIEH